MESRAPRSPAASTSAARKRGRPRQYTADEVRERKNAARRAKRRAARSTATKPPDANTRRAERAAAQRARRQHEAIRKREAEADRQAKRLKRQDEAFRRREAEAKRRRRQEQAEARRQMRGGEAEARSRLHRAATDRFVKAFVENPFGSACSVCDRLWFTDDRTKAPEKTHSLLEQHFPVGEALPAADGVKARRTRVHRTERRWPLVTCPHHSTSAAGTLRVATADFSAVFPDIDFKQAVETACDKAPFIEASLAGTTCQVEPWRGLQDKCVGECEALLQHAEQSCQTEHHITLVRCTKPQVSTCSVEVQADPWWQHHCGIQPIGVDLCET
nr:uncharacterized protein LOC126528975 isoform X2 [Dermacentor andersoni]